MNYPSSRYAGFSLVELSIVLVILGLLVGAVLSGQSLIRAAEMRRFIQQLQHYQMAVQLFREKYHGLPGDINYATRFWPEQTHDGNHNGSIESLPWDVYDAYTPDSGRFDFERPEFFRQLSLAGLVAEAFDGSVVLGKGYPEIAMARGNGMIVSGGWTYAMGANPSLKPVTEKTAVYLAVMVCRPELLGVSSSFNDCGIFAPEVVWQLDSKIDDGLPLSGAFVAYSSTYNHCITMPDAVYHLLDGGSQCGAMFRLY